MEVHASGVIREWRDSRPEERQHSGGVLVLSHAGGVRHVSRLPIVR